METTKRIIDLLHKHVRQELDAEELRELTSWVDRHPAFQQLLDEVSDEKDLSAALREFDKVYGADKMASIARMEARIKEGVRVIPETRSTSVGTRYARKWLAYAAAILVVVTAAFWIFRDDQVEDSPKVVELKTADIAPGGNRARLTLADGRTIELREDQAGIVVDDNDIAYLDGTELGQSILSSNDTVDFEVMALTLSTPIGGTYQLTLPDGSKVWLNAASTLKYPSRFIGQERVVELEGEGYFEIANDKKRPFKVLSSGQEIDVLGTEFNVSAYPDEAVTKTTLVEGSLKVVNLQSNMVNNLHPGEQAVVAGSVLRVAKIGIESYVAWKNGYFYFDRLSTKEALAQLARWYDLDVVYEGAPLNTNVFAFIDRNKSLDAVLRSLEKSGLKFRVIQSEGRIRLLVLGEK